MFLRTVAVGISVFSMIACSVDAKEDESNKPNNNKGDVEQTTPVEVVDNGPVPTPTPMATPTSDPVVITVPVVPTFPYDLPAIQAGTTIGLNVGNGLSNIWDFRGVNQVATGVSGKPLSEEDSKAFHQLIGFSFSVAKPARLVLSHVQAMDLCDATAAFIIKDVKRGILLDGKVLQPRLNGSTVWESSVALAPNSYELLLHVKTASKCNGSVRFYSDLK